MLKTALLMFSTLILAAQPPGGPMRPGGPPQPPAAEVKAALGLTDQQVSQLTQVQRDRMQAQRPTFERIGEKQKSLNEMLEKGGADPTAVGRLILDIQDLRKQAPENDKRYREQALQILTPEQKTKLKSLEDALKLRPAADQAIGLNLLQPPAGPGPGEFGPFAPRMREGPGRMRGFGGPRQRARE